MPYVHTPVLLAEVLAAFQPQPGQVYIDSTIGGGGHAAALLRHIQPGGRLLGIDADPAAIQASRARLAAVAGTPAEGQAYCLCQGSFDTLQVLALAQGFSAVDGILFDLGVSSHQLDTPERGFALSADGPLDMRLNPIQPTTAADLVANLDEQSLADMIYRYGEERYARRIARRIVERRQQQPILTTGDLTRIVLQAIGSVDARKQRRPVRIHPATRTFQALRIAVNRELEQLEAALPQAVELLRPGGRLVVISFHSLEDRIVKLFLRAESGYGGSEAPDRPVRLQIITRKPVEPAEAETRANPRSRSARMRVAERIKVVDNETHRGVVQDAWM